MNTMAAQVDVPPEHITDGRATPAFDSITAVPEQQRLMHVRSSKESRRMPASQFHIADIGSASMTVILRPSALELIFEYRVTFSSRETGGSSQHPVATLEFENKKRFNLDISFTWDRISIPETDASMHTPNSDDFRLNVGLGVDL